MTVEAVVAVEMVTDKDVVHLHERPRVGPLERLVARAAQQLRDIELARLP